MYMYKKFVKRAIDILLSSIGIIFLALPMLIISIIVKLDSPGPVLFKQLRFGKKRTHFKIYKFRSMPITAPANAPTNSIANEVVLSKFQEGLRKSSLDEIPQLFNIFLGQMSLVGPRPVILQEEDLIDERDKYDANDLTPGLTGWAQINGRDDINNIEKAKFDGEYKEKISFLFDLKCLIGTIKPVLFKNGAR